MNTPTKISPNFYYHEVFSRGIWQAGNETSLKRLLDPGLMPLMELIRSTIGKPIICNTWYWNLQSAQYRGFRPQNTSVGALYSQHKMGRAMDFKVNGMSANAARTILLNNEQMLLDAGLTRIEDGRDAPTWVHIDMAWTGMNKIHVFRA